MKLKLGLLGDSSIYVGEMISNLRDYCDLSLFMFDKKNNYNKPFSGDYKYYKLNQYRYLFEILPAYIKLKKHSKDIDVIGVHFLEIRWEILLALHAIKKPVVYFVYGSDVNRTYSKLHTILKKYVLRRFDKIFVETTCQINLLKNRYGIDISNVEISVLWWNVNPCFNRILDSQEMDILRKKWDLNKKYIIFSPRTCVKRYQHDLLIMAIAQLDKSIRNQIQVVVTQANNSEKLLLYIESLKKLADGNGVSLTVIPKRLSPEEMSEIYNISQINVNIPDADLLARSILEGSLCGSIPLLNDNIDNYHDFMNNNINCVFVKPDVVSISEGILDIIVNYNKYKESMYSINLNLFSKYQDVNNNSKKLCSIIFDLVKK